MSTTAHTIDLPVTWRAVGEAIRLATWTLVACVWFVVLCAMYLFLWARTIYDGDIISTTWSWRGVLHHAAARCCYLFFQRAGGIMPKYAQLAGPKLNKFSPQVYDRLKEFCDEVPPMTMHELICVLPSDWATKFETIDLVPIKAGTIGQVHKGSILVGDNDRVDVAIKIKRLDIDARVVAQLTALKWFTYLIHVLHVPFISKLGLAHRFPSFVGMMMQQLNFIHEIKETEWFFHKFQDHTSIVTPRVYSDWCTDEIIVTQWLDGVPLHRLDDVSVFQHAINPGQSPVRTLKHSMVAFVCSTSYMMHHFHADLQPGNVLYLPRERKLGLIDFGLTGTLEPQEAAIERAFLCALCDGEWKEAATCLIEKMFFRPASAIALSVEEKERIYAHTVDVIQRTLGQRDVRYHDFALEISPFLEQQGYEPNTCFTVFEMTLVSAEGSMRIAFPADNIWELFRDIAEEVHLPIKSVLVRSGKTSEEQQASIALSSQLEAMFS